MILVNYKICFIFKLFLFLSIEITLHAFVLHNFSYVCMYVCMLTLIFQVLDE